MKITARNKAVVQYELLNANTGHLIESTPDDQPANFSFGNNQLIPEFEKNLMGLSKGDTFDFIIKSESAYGPIDGYAIFDIPLDTFEVDGKIDEKMIQLGNMIPMTDDKGNKHLGKIIKILDNSITMDFNHPLAGTDLQFIGKILEII